MPNLETLSIEIDGNSQKASEGISSLIGSLRRLAKAIGTCVPALKQMNASLEVLQKFGTMRLPNFGNQAASNISKVAKSITGAVGKFPTADEIRKSNEAMEAMRKANSPVALPGEARQAQVDWFKRQQELRKIANEQKRLEMSAEKAAPSLKNTAVAIKETAVASEQAKPKVSGFVKLMEQIGRIAKTLVIRTALRALMKSFSETWSAAYEYSRQIGGDFAKSVEKARGSIATLSTSLIKVLSPVLIALVPVIQAITSGISYLCTMIQKLFSLLGMGSDLFGATSEAIDKYSNSAGSGSKATKNLLASFDQLNVIQSQSNGGSGAGAGGKSFLSDMVSEEMAKINIIVAESLMGIGLILACTGHVGLGLGMLAVGAGMFAKAMTEDWKKLPNSVRRTIAEITIISGVGMLALGVMAMCAGHIPLGLGLLALGAASIGVTMYAANGQDIGREVKDTITEILAVAGVSLMAVGLIVAIAGNIPLGIGLIAAGAAAYVGAAAYNPEGLVQLAQGIVDKITGFFTGAWNSIKGVWLTAAKWMDDNVFKPIGDFATKAWETISTWWTTNITDNLSLAWNSVTEFFRTLFGSTEVPGSIAAFANDAWCSVSDWWETNIIGNLKAAWDGVVEFFKGIFEAILSPLRKIWDYISDVFGIGNHKADYTLNVQTNITWDDVTSFTPKRINIDDYMNQLGIKKKADGAYGIPKGDLFIANEAGAELVGSMNGKTTVANQEEIVAGIQAGVRNANEAQNELLREQNRLLRMIADKNFEPQPSAAWGSFMQRSSDMWNMATGR